MKLVFFGSPNAAVRSLKKILEKGHHVELVITQPDRPAGRRKRTAQSPVKNFSLERNIPVYQPEKIRKDPIALEKIKKIDPELNVVVAYGQIIPKSIFDYPVYNSINVHFSLLPKYRGASPVQWAVLNGEQKTGITIFELNEKMDEGDILASKEVRILPREYAYALEDRLAEIGAELLCKTIDQIERIPHQKQNHSQATYAPKITKDQGRIDWKEEALLLDRKVRAFTPWPSTFCYLEKKRIKILRGKGEPGKISDTLPGTVLNVKKEGLEVGCGAGSVYLIEELQPEGKRPMNAYAFTLGENLNRGDKFA
jgi:methionyl-tRNA formyltransferase